MGAGLAKQIAKAYPRVEMIYKGNTPKLGQAQIIQVGAYTWIANLCAQDSFGCDPNVVYTNYTALLKCLERLEYMALGQIYIPYHMGCGLANGNWDIVRLLVETTTPSAIIVKRKQDV